MLEQPSLVALSSKEQSLRALQPSLLKFNRLPQIIWFLQEKHLYHHCTVLTFFNRNPSLLCSHRVTVSPESESSVEKSPETSPVWGDIKIFQNINLENFDFDPPSVLMKSSPMGG